MTKSITFFLHNHMILYKVFPPKKTTFAHRTKPLIFNGFGSIFLIHYGRKHRTPTDQR